MFHNIVFIAQTIFKTNNFRIFALATEKLTTSQMKQILLINDVVGYSHVGMVAMQIGRAHV